VGIGETVTFVAKYPGRPEAPAFGPRLPHSYPWLPLSLLRAVVGLPGDLTHIAMPVADAPLIRRPDPPEAACAGKGNLLPSSTVARAAQLVTIVTSTFSFRFVLIRSHQPSTE
jgi:hypothetical protein